MNYIVFDLEFNQDLTSLQENDRIHWQIDTLVADKKALSQFPYEIIQIGAVKLDERFHTLGTFNMYVKPAIYQKVNPIVTEITGITGEQLMEGEPFSKAYQSFMEFINEPQSIFCVWGVSDMKVLYKNAEYYKLNTKLIPRMYINPQPYVPKYLNLPQKNLLRLQTAVELLDIPIIYEFHNALYDAYYTAEILKKVYNMSLQPKVYDPK